jgi:hypothetical protein
LRAQLEVWNSIFMLAGGQPSPPIQAGHEPPEADDRSLTPVEASQRECCTISYVTNFASLLTGAALLLPRLPLTVRYPGLASVEACLWGHVVWISLQRWLCAAQAAFYGEGGTCFKAAANSQPNYGATLSSPPATTP